MARGWTYEPPTFYEINEAVSPAERAGATCGQWVEPSSPETTELLSLTTETHSILEPASQSGRHANITADAEG